MSKTPYEIRLELLKLAKESLFEPVYHKRDSLREKYQVDVNAGQKPDTPYPDLPTFPTTDEIVAEAEKLNGFISKQ